MKIAYCDCYSGISGDMFLAALVDAGLPVEALREQLGWLELAKPMEVSFVETKRGTLRACLAAVTPSGSLHQWHLKDIERLIGESRLSSGVKGKSLAIFALIAEAEGRVHGISPEEVHFHDAGELDSMMDVVGAVIGMEMLGIEQLYASALPLTSGPLPAPAAMEILSRVHAPLTPSPATVELVTPTGAAILAVLAKFERPSITLERIGMGAGRLEYLWPNVLRLSVGTSAVDEDLPLVLMETNIDDMNPQMFGSVMAHLFEAGARDVFFTPIYMKKNRPATMLSVIARRSEESHLARILLEETTTLGLRIQPVYRFEAEREFRTVQTVYGPILVKVKILDGKRVHAQPEYDACLALAEAQHVPVSEVYTAALLAGRAMLER